MIMMSVGLFVRAKVCIFLCFYDWLLLRVVSIVVVKIVWLMSMFFLILMCIVVMWLWFGVVVCLGMVISCLLLDDVIGVFFVDGEVVGDRVDGGVDGVVGDLFGDGVDGVEGVVGVWPVLVEVIGRPVDVLCSLVFFLLLLCFYV